MPLDGSLEQFVPAAPAGLVRVSPQKWAATIRDFVAAKALKKKLDAEARAADAQCKALRSQLFPALSGAPSVVCGHQILTLKATAPAQAALTLRDGSKIMWSAVQAVTVNGRRIVAEDIASLYGGRSGSEDIDVAGAP